MYSVQEIRIIMGNCKNLYELEAVKILTQENVRPIQDHLRILTIYLDRIKILKPCKQ